MKKLVKIFSMIAILAVGLSCVSCDDKDEPAGFADLPLKAQDFINTYFATYSSSNITYDEGDGNHAYKIVFDNGYEIQFNKDGEWTDVDAPDGQSLPTAFMPEGIVSYVNDNYTGQGINEIEKEKKQYNVELTNGVDLIFNLDGTFNREDR